MPRSQKLEAILHPRIRERWLAQIEAGVPRQSEATAARGKPCARRRGDTIAFETRAESHFEKIICVACSAENQRHACSPRLDAGADRTAQLPRSGRLNKKSPAPILLFGRIAIWIITRNKSNGFCLRCSGGL